MALIRAFKPGFIGGEISPRFYPRIDLPSQPYSCRVVKNFLVKNSLLQKRPGLRMVKFFDSDKIAVFKKQTWEGDRLIIIRSYSGVGLGKYYEINGTTPTEKSRDHNFNVPILYSDFQYTQPLWSAQAFEETDSQSVIGALWMGTKNIYPCVHRTNLIDIGETDDYFEYDTLTWDSTVTYGLHELISNGGSPPTYYISLQAANLNHVVTDGAWWSARTRAAAGQPTSDVWPFGLKSSTPTDNYTATGKVYSAVEFNRRLYLLGRAFTNGNTVLAGSQSLFARYLATNNLVDDQPFKFVIVEAIQEPKWIVGKDFLFIGTELGEFKVTVENVTPTNIQIEKISDYGSGDYAVQIQDTIVFSSKDNKKLYAVNYQEAQQQYVAQDISLMYEHIFSDEVRQMKVILNPDPMLWVLLDDGNLIGISFDRATGLNGAFQFETDGTVLNMDVMTTTKNDVLALAIERENGVTLEYLDYQQGGPVAYLDSYVEVSFGSITAGVMSGLDHLEGESVYAVHYVTGVDSFDVYGPYTVESGDITLLRNGEAWTPTTGFISAGLPYTAEMETLTMEIPSQRGVNLNNEKQVSKATPYLVDTAQIKIADQVGNYVNVNFRKATDATSTPVPLYTGYKETEVEGTWDRESRVKIKSDLPLACNVVSMVIGIKIKGDN